MECRENNSGPEQSEMCLNSLQKDYQLDFFHKLGYATEQVHAVLRKFGEQTDTNRVLEELVRTGASTEVKEGPVTIMSVLVPRDNGALKTPNLSLPVSLKTREQPTEGGEALRPIVIDGSNVAVSHGNKEVFSCLGILLAVNFFLDRNHTDITVFVPSWRKEQPRPDSPITNQRILRDLERKKILVFTPSRRVAGKRVVCYDDRFIVKLAYESDGVIVSNDTYRDLQGENPEWKRFIEDRLLMYSFVNNKFMPPDDPVGRHGPTLENFLRRVPKKLKKHMCPYGKKCTYGIKCKFHHPERANQSSYSLADELRDKARLFLPHAKQSLVCFGPGSTVGLSLEKEMVQKLSLDHCSGSLKKGHASENVLVRAAPCSSRKGPFRKEIATSHHSPSELDSFNSSREKLDSGYGSVDCQPNEHCIQHYGECSWSCQPAPNKREQCFPPQSAPCSCFSHATACFQQYSNSRHSTGPPQAHNPDMSYSLTQCPNYGEPVYPINKLAYSHTTRFQYNRSVPPEHNYSESFGIYHPSMPDGRSHWEHPHGDERQNVRKKLLAIFHVRLVDKAMERFPEVMDPQMLAAEILTLQGQGRAL